MLRPGDRSHCPITRIREKVIYTNRGMSLYSVLAAKCHPGGYRVNGFLLRLTQLAAEKAGYRIEIFLKLGVAPEKDRWFILNFESILERRRISVGLEEYLEYPQDASQLSARIEQRMSDVGTQLFGCNFQATESAQLLGDQLEQTRIEIVVPVVTP